MIELVLTFVKEFKTTKIANGNRARNIDSSETTWELPITRECKVSINGAFAVRGAEQGWLGKTMLVI